MPPCRVTGVSAPFAHALLPLSARTRLSPIGFLPHNQEKESPNSCGLSPSASGFTCRTSERLSTQHRTVRPVDGVHVSRMATETGGTAAKEKTLQGRPGPHGHWLAGGFPTRKPPRVVWVSHTVLQAMVRPRNVWGHPARGVSKHTRSLGMSPPTEHPASFSRVTALDRPTKCHSAPGLGFVLLCPRREVAPIIRVRAGKQPKVTALLRDSVLTAAGAAGLQSAHHDHPACLVVWNYWPRIDEV